MSKHKHTKTEGLDKEEVEAVQEHIAEPIKEDPEVVPAVDPKAPREDVKIVIAPTPGPNPIVPQAEELISKN